MTRLLPFPLVTLGLLILWLLLNESVSPGAILLGSVLALVGGGALWLLAPPAGRPRRVLAIARLLWDVLIEIIRSNNAVATLILRGPRSQAGRSGFVLIPLAMRSPYGLAALACILTATPGTVWVDYDAEDGTMLLHVLDLIDEEQWMRIVKDNWERRLMEIFE
ncbi:Na+/H+ antiporter subunit E [Elioraea rosea]|uniref:Na+/H+ antiporter subunit E n=1 Tax=Elioraea rosea TaxID=2492390 RepID=UPI001183D1DF|nr:Na+/H+ antiporter subunit E [Elioraea rosea]